MSFEVSEFDPRSSYVPLLRKELRATGVLEDDWTMMRLRIAVPDGPYRFNFSPDRNTVVVVDENGARYGNVYARGPIERLPAHLRRLLDSAVVGQDELYDGVLLFRPTLRPGEVKEVWMMIGGKFQQLFSAP
jgi:hypothetical protein